MAVMRKRCYGKKHFRVADQAYRAQPCYRNIDFKIHTCVVAQMKRFLMLIKSYVNHFDQTSIFITFLALKLKTV